jgi:hypothetical protein
MKRFLVLTSITGKKDVLNDPQVVYDNCDYIAYVDFSYETKIWQQRKAISFSSIDYYQNRRNAKVYKILSTVHFPDYEYILWVDGNHTLKINPEEILQEYGADHDLYLFKHPDRTCLYEEMKTVAVCGLDSRSNIKEQQKFYKRDCMPDQYGLYESPTFMTKNTPASRQLQLMWWEQICRFSSRDQISLPYCLWKMQDQIKIAVLKGFANIYSMKGKNSGNNYFHDEGMHLW